jgi:prephenate dehydratase
MKIAIQGTKGSYHHQAAEKFFGTSSMQLEELDSFKKVAQSITKSYSDYGLMAIENTIAGTLLPNYSLVSKYDLKIIGEVHLPIQHQLMALPGTKFEEIQEIQSHPMAILQCDQFLEHHPTIRIVETNDTASTAKKIQDSQLKNIAAIASELAAEIYGLEIIKRNIQTFPKNFTRFFVLAKDQEAPTRFNKASILFTTPHQSGSLASILNELVYLNVNMEKIQSVPIIEKPWEYAFHVDVSFESIEEFDLLIQRIQLKTHYLKILGKYTKENHLLTEEKSQENQKISL